MFRTLSLHQGSMCSENVPAWSRQDVCFFLERLGLEDLKLAFQKNAVDGGLQALFKETRR